MLYSYLLLLVKTKRKVWTNSCEFWALCFYIASHSFLVFLQPVLALPAGETMQCKFWHFCIGLLLYTGNSFPPFFTFSSSDKQPPPHPLASLQFFTFFLNIFVLTCVSSTFALMKMMPSPASNAAAVSCTWIVLAEHFARLSFYFLAPCSAQWLPKFGNIRISICPDWVEWKPSQMHMFISFVPLQPSVSGLSWSPETSSAAPKEQRDFMLKLDPWSAPQGGAGWDGGGFCHFFKFNLGCLMHIYCSNHRPMPSICSAPIWWEVVQDDIHRPFKKHIDKQE